MSERQNSLVAILKGKYDHPKRPPPNKGADGSGGGSGAGGSKSGESTSESSGGSNTGGSSSGASDGSSSSRSEVSSEEGSSTSQNDGASSSDGRSGRIGLVGAAVLASAVVAAAFLRRPNTVKAAAHPLKGSLNRRMNLFNEMAKHSQSASRPPRNVDDVYLPAPGGFQGSRECVGQSLTF